MLLQAKNGNLLNSKDDNDYDEYDFALGITFLLGHTGNCRLLLSNCKLQISPPNFSLLFFCMHHMMDIFRTIFNEDDYDKDNEYDDEND